VTCRRPGGPDDGAAAVEFAVILPLLVLLLGGIIDFGFAFNAQISLTHAAREGVRVEALRTDNGLTRAQAAFTAPVVTNVGGSRTACPPPPAPNAQAQVTITAQYDFIILPLATRTLRGEAVMRCGG
jgi:Flp pilus assembly protein TadG